MIYSCQNECGHALMKTRLSLEKGIQKDNIKREKQSTTKICLREFLPDVLEPNTEINLELSSV